MSATELIERGKDAAEMLASFVSRYERNLTAEAVRDSLIGLRDGSRELEESTALRTK